MDEDPAELSTTLLVTPNFCTSPDYSI